MATLTLRNVPDDLVARLKERAKRNRRSLNSETISTLELVDAAAEGRAAPQAPAPLDRQAALARIREIQARFPGARNSRPDPRSAEEIQAQLDRFAELRRHFKGSPLTSEEIIEAIGRDSHPPDLDHVAAAEQAIP